MPDPNDQELRDLDRRLTELERQTASLEQRAGGIVRPASGGSGLTAGNLFEVYQVDENGNAGWRYPIWMEPGSDTSE